LDTQNHPLQKEQWIRLGLFCIACVLAVNGILFNQIVLALLASVAMCCSFWNLNDSLSTQDDAITQDKYEVTSTRLFLTITLLIAAVLAGMGSVYFSKNPEFGTTSLFLWLTAIVLIMLAGIIFDRVSPFNWLKRIKNLSPEAQKNLFIEAAMVFVITGVALLLRVISLDRFPVSMHGDEGEMGMEALRFLGIGYPISPFGVGWGLFSNLYYYMLAGSIHIFGRNEIGLRMVSALFGTFCAPLVYLIGRKFWGKLAGFTGAWLVAVSHFNIHFSRSGLNNIESVFFILLFILLFLSTHSQGRKLGKSDVSNFLKGNFNITPYIAIGLTCGLAQYMYLGSRLILLVALPLYGFLLVRKRIGIIQLAAMGFAAVLVFAPLGMLYLQTPDAFTARIKTVSIFDSEGIKDQYEQNDALSENLSSVIQDQFTKNINFYIQSGDIGFFSPPEIPGFDFITALLFWLGLGVVFSSLRRLPELVLILWFVLGFIFGGVLTDYSPYGPRLLMSTPAIFIMGGVFVQRTWNVLNDFFNKISNGCPSLVWVSAPILFCIFLATLGINMNYYFGVYPKSSLHMVLMDITKEIISDAPMNHVYLLGDGEIYVGHGTIRFLAGEGKATDIKDIDDLPPLVKDGEGITVLATLNHAGELDSLKPLYPQGHISGKYFFGRLILMKYQIPPLPLQ
jgi:4-amino-4-deoxy-L-arabinose transferase-like glycosyltransferase